MKSIVMFLTVLVTGLSAGLWYAWAVSVIPGTKLTTDPVYLETMQHINRAIPNPWFFLVFFGPLFLMAASAFMQYKTSVDLAFWLIIGAGVAYLIGTLGVTMFGNVPLNESLDAIQLSALSSEEINSTRAGYENLWNRFHLIRTFFSVLSFVLILLAERMAH